MMRRKSIEDIEALLERAEKHLRVLILLRMAADDDWHFFNRRRQGGLIS